MYTQFHIPTRKHIKFIPQKDTKKKKKDNTNVSDSSSNVF